MPLNSLNIPAIFEVSVAELQQARLLHYRAGLYLDLRIITMAKY